MINNALNFKKILPHLITVGIFVSLSLIYFSPVLDGKVVDMKDIIQFKGMSQESKEYRDANNGEQTLWTGSSFSGMPIYQTGMKSDNNLVKYINKFIKLGLPRPADLLFLHLLGFYILLISLKVDYRVAIIGSCGFAFCSFPFISIAAGHTSKVLAMGYIPLIVSSVLYTFNNKKWLIGVVFTSLFVALQLCSNHYQITYYTILILLFIAIIQFIKELRNKTLYNFFKKSAFLLLAALLAAGTNYTVFATTLEYSDLSQRGQSELKDNSKNSSNGEGLSYDYITSYSYGVSETMTLLIPNFKGGAMSSLAINDKESHSNKYWVSNQDKISQYKPQKQNDIFLSSQLYWGDKNSQDKKFGPGAPTYIGAIVVFLFVLSLLYYKSIHKYWILPMIVVAVMLSWGYHLSWFSQFFIDYFPMYNKFRAVQWFLIIASFGVVLISFLSLNKFFNDSDIDSRKDKLKKAFYISGGITLLFTLLPSLFLDFRSPDDNIIDPSLTSALISDRTELLTSDAWRSFLFILFAVLTLWLFLKDVIKKQYAILIIGALIIGDMWSINKRYLSEDNNNYVSKNQFIIPQTLADTDILTNNTEKSRVFETRGTFNNSRASFFHNSIGGYSAAKLMRYQDLYSKYIIPTLDTTINGIRGNYTLSAPHKNKILSMLNCGWIIDNSNSNNFVSYRSSSEPFGHVRFIDSIVYVETPDDELNSLAKIDPLTTAVVNKKFKFDKLKKNNGSLISLDLDSYKPNHLTYKIEKSSKFDKLAVFSEIYYKNGWNAYIDGKIVPHFRANYVLRAMIVPAGTKKIEFKFEPSTFEIGEKVALASSIILLLLLVFVSYKELKVQ